jgi:Skp family chaperone for outer membrane proteins
MTRMTLAITIGALTLAATGLAQTPPPTQTPPPKPPATQTPPPLLPRPPAPAQAVPPAPPVPFPADSKIAFISMQVIVAQSNLGKAGQKQMQALQDKKATELAAKSKAIQTLQQEISQQTNVLSASVIATKTADLEKAQREAQFSQQDFDAQITSLNEQLLANFQDKVLPILEAMRNEKGLWAIFSVQDSGAAAVHPGLDLSAEVVKRLDASVKVPPPIGQS